MALTDKNRSLIGSQNLGGAPFYGTDFGNLQENAKKDALAFFEGLVSKTPTEIQVDGGGATIKSFKAGVWMQEPTVDLADPANAVVGSGYFYVDGEAVYFAGGTFNISGQSVLIIGKDLGTKTASTFEDGQTKDQFIKYASTAVASTETATGVQIPNSIDEAKQYVMLDANGVRPSHTAAYALGVNAAEARLTELENRNTFEAWQTLTPAGNITLTLGRTLRYKKTPSGKIKLEGGGTQTGTIAGDNILGTLPSGYYPTTLNKQFIAAIGSSGDPAFISIGNGGAIVLSKPNATTYDFTLDGIEFEL